VGFSNSQVKRYWAFNQTVEQTRIQAMDYLNQEGIGGANFGQVAELYVMHLYNPKGVLDEVLIS
jgi:hypothetical protein